MAVSRLLSDPQDVTRCNAIRLYDITQYYRPQLVQDIVNVYGLRGAIFRLTTRGNPSRTASVWASPVCLGNNPAAQIRH
eukprot:14264670-Heterocapsa_arctica.AAC.1